jgi:hypothetical protein
MLEVPWGEARLLLRGVHRVEHTRTQIVQQRKLSLGRAVLTGGLMVTKTVKKSKHEVLVENEGFLQLYAPGRPPLDFRQADLNYAGLVPAGAALQPSVAANFVQLVAALRAACPRAVYDERLATLPGQARLLGPSLQPERYLDLAVTLLSRSLLGFR